MDHVTGDLVTVAHAHDQAEAELVQGLLREVGVSSLVQRSGGFDVPDYLAGGPRDVLVAAGDLPRAQEVLVADAAPAPALPPAAGTRPSRLLAALLIAAAVAAAVICVAVDVLA
jgi:hypothetical protein